MQSLASTIHTQKGTTHKVLANHTFIHTVSEWIPLIAVVIIGLGYLFGSWRRGLSDSWKETVDLQAAELDTVKQSNVRLTKEVHESKEQIAKFEGIVAQLRRENAELRSMVMLDKVPPALIETMNSTTETIMTTVLQIHKQQTEDLLKSFEAMLHPVAQGMSRLLTEPRGEK